MPVRDMPTIKLDENTTQKDVAKYNAELWNVANGCNSDMVFLRDYVDRMK